MRCGEFEPRQGWRTRVTSCGPNGLAENRERVGDTSELGVRATSLWLPGCGERNEYGCCRWNNLTNERSSVETGYLLSGFVRVDAMPVEPEYSTVHRFECERDLPHYTDHRCMVLGRRPVAAADAASCVDSLPYAECCTFETVWPNFFETFSGAGAATRC